MRLAIFLAAESIFNLGLSVFFLLYNLYLLERGFDESFLGLVTALLTLGSVCGTLPAGWFTARYGVGAALRITFLGGAGVCAAQAWVTSREALLALSFVGGLAAAFRAVTLAPAIAELTSASNRARGFSLFFALGIGMGILGGLLGGQLPGWMPQQQALWAGCGFAALAVVPTLALRFAPGGRERRQQVVYPRSPFVRRYLAAAAAWNLFVGAFPSFFNVYFARRFGAAASRIGLIFSGSQLAQVGALLLAPVVYARAGLGRGIALTQIAAAATLALLAPRWPLAAAGALYGAYMSFQYMSEPGWQTLLMNGVADQDRSGASALNFLVVFGAQAIAAALFGRAASRLGYPAPLGGTAVVGLAAAAVFLRLLASSTTSQTSRR